MSTKDIKQKTKTSLMDELKSIKGVLDADDDNVPLLLDDDDIPVLAEDDDSDIPVLADDDDVPILTAPKDTTSANQASLEAALRQLESMELSPKPAKPQTNKTESLEEKIRSNAAPPLFDDKATTVRDNPFLTKKPTDRFSESRKQAEEALKSVIAHSRTAAQPNRPAVFESKKPTATPIVEDRLSESPIEFTDNQFLKASSAPVPVSAAISGATSNKSSAPAVKQKEDGSDDILKLLDEDSGLDLDLGEDFGELVDIDVDAMIAEDSSPAKPATKTAPAKNAPATSSTKNKPTEKELDQIVDEVIEEYMIILEVALKKKLKEKLPDLLKK